MEEAGLGAEDWIVAATLCVWACRSIAYARVILHIEKTRILSKGTKKLTGKTGVYEPRVLCFQLVIPEP
jgi:hypothetical protein